MDDYIKREDAINVACGDCPYNCSEVRKKKHPCAEYKELMAIPPADVEPVKHGHWIEGPMCIECSCCGETFSDEIVYMCDPYRKPKRCPECGAHMDEEVNDGQDDRDR